MLKAAIPMLHVSSAEAAESFFCEQLGFGLRSAMRIDDSGADPCYMIFKRDDASIHASSFSGDGVAGGVAFVIVDDIDELHAELVGKDVLIDTGPVDQSWGNREMYVRDVDGNSIRFIQPKG